MQDNQAALAAPFSLRVGLLIDGNAAEPTPDALVQIAEGRIMAVEHATDFGGAASDAIDFQLAKLERYFECFLEVINRLYAMGLVDRMASGSDAGPFDTEFGHIEYSVDLARQAGLSPMESLQAVTRNAARLCGLEDRVGSVRVGRDADLLLLSANPLEHARNLTGAAVYKSGLRVYEASSRHARI